MTILGPRTRRSLVLFAVVAFGLASCTGDDPTSGSPAAQGTPEPSSTTSTDDEVDDADVLGKRTIRKTRLAVVGDFGMANEAEFSVAGAMRKWTQTTRVAGLLTTGDNIYPVGHPEAFRAAWHEPYGWVDRSNLTKVASLGNHDHATDAGGDVMGLLDMPSRWYRHHFRFVDVFVLDSNRVYDEAQKLWLRRALRRSDARWQVVAFHHPPYSCGEHDSYGDVQDAFVGIFERFGADLVLNGHEHSYLRFKRTHGVTYVVTGGGGADLYDLDPCPTSIPKRLVANDRHHHFVKLTATRSTLRWEAIAPGGKRLDRHGLTR